MLQIKTDICLIKHGSVYHQSNLLLEMSAAKEDGQSDVDLGEISVINVSVLLLF